VLAGGLAQGNEPLQGGVNGPAVLGFSEAPTCSADDMDSDAIVLDLADSKTYARGHVPGAWWAVRARLGAEIDGLPAAPRIVMTSPDGTLAHLAAPEVAALRPHADVRVLAGGTDAWVAAGGAFEEGLERRLSEPDDLWKKPYEQVKAGEERQAMEDYLTWELALVEQIARDGTADFHVR
jgi:rhodanese-related sulfurtransferase